jgi:hypothetical protein
MFITVDVLIRLDGRCSETNCLQASQDRYGSALRDIPSTIDQETTISYINTFGKSGQPLFGEMNEASSQAQLVVVLEGVTAENAKPLKEALGKSHIEPGFHISNPPSSAANNRLLNDFHAAGVSTPSTCDLDSAINPNDDSCWDRPSLFVKFDVLKV